MDPCASRHAARSITRRGDPMAHISAAPGRSAVPSYWNAWRDAESTWSAKPHGWQSRRREHDAGFLDVRRFASVADVSRTSAVIAPDDGNAADRTVMTVALGSPSGQPTVDVEIEWTSKVPRPFARTGYVGNTSSRRVSKLGVSRTALEYHQFHAATEFYADFGVYDGTSPCLGLGWALRARRRGRTTPRNATQSIAARTSTTCVNNEPRLHRGTAGVPASNAAKGRCVALQPRRRANHDIRRDDRVPDVVRRMFGAYPYDTSRSSTLL